MGGEGDRIQVSLLTLLTGFLLGHVGVVFGPLSDTDFPFQR